VDTLAKVLAAVFLAAMMLAIGLEVTARAIADELRDRSYIIRALVANLVVVPVVGITLALAVPMPGDVRAGVVLLAFAPGAPFAIQFTSRARGRVALAAGLLFLLAATSLVVTPLAAWLMFPVELVGTPLRVPVLRLVFWLVVLAAAPLAVGLLATRVLGRAGPKLASALHAVSMLAFVSLMIHTTALRSEAMRAVSGGGVAALALLLLAGMAMGWLMGGPDIETREILVTGTSMRNVAICLAIASLSLPESTVGVVAVAYAGLMIPANMLFTLAVRLTLRRRAKRAVSSEAAAGPGGGKRDEGKGADDKRDAA
jgi:BASS family bile acid:Na+ symporter